MSNIFILDDDKELVKLLNEFLAEYKLILL